MAKRSPCGANWRPSGNVTLQPVPWRLMPVAAYNGREVVAANGPPGWQGVRFDQWERGDLVAVEMPHHVTYAFGHKAPANRPALATWIVGRRGTVPSAHTQKYDFGLGAVPVGTRAKLWRVPYEWCPAAEKLVGQEFETREALEAALYLARCGRDVAA